MERRLIRLDEKLYGCSECPWLQKCNYCSDNIRPRQQMLTEFHLHKCEQNSIRPKVARSHYAGALFSDTGTELETNPRSMSEPTIRTKSYRPLSLRTNDTPSACGSLIAIYWGSSFPARSRTMYSAYQSGQLGSAFPIRASCFPCAVAARIIASERSFTDAYVVSPAIRPGSRDVTSCSTHPLPSGSLKEAKEP